MFKFILFAFSYVLLGLSLMLIARSLFISKEKFHSIIEADKDRVAFILFSIGFWPLTAAIFYSWIFIRGGYFYIMFLRSFALSSKEEDKPQHPLANVVD